MVVIRLTRQGAKKRPFYHIVALDKRKRRDGAFLDRLGFFNPIAAGQETKLRVNRERIDYWVSQGAQLSQKVTLLLKELDKSS